MTLLNSFFDGFVHLFYPKVCVSCARTTVMGEHFICLDCLNDIPRTQFFNLPDNMVEQAFWGRIEIDSATAFFKFEKGSKYQKLLHIIKYKGGKELGKEFGRYIGHELKHAERFSMITKIVPVPLHPKKMRIRGYNQSEWIAKGIAEVLNKPLEINGFKRAIYNPTQTRKSKMERWENVSGIFKVTIPQIFDNEHILLVDDVITTGATIEACATQLLQSKNTKVSVVALALA